MSPLCSFFLLIFSLKRRCCRDGSVQSWSAFLPAARWPCHMAKELCSALFWVEMWPLGESQHYVNPMRPPHHISLSSKGVLRDSSGEGKSSV